MRKIFCLLLVLILPVIMLFTGCSNKAETIDAEGTLFVAVADFYFDSSYTYFVLVHKETKVMYLTQNNGGMILMVNPDGTPMIWEGEL